MAALERKMQQVPLPPGALLETYQAQPGCHVDCFCLDTGHAVSLERYIIAFFDSWVFRAERGLLKLLKSSPSSLHDVRALADGSGSALSGWHTEARNATQLLLAVQDSPVRTWLMLEGLGQPAPATRLYFGSAVLATSTRSDGAPRIAWPFRLLMSVHVQYSRLLLSQAARALA